MGDDGDDRTKKLALAIRSATESDDFDLAGYSAEACDALAQNAFAKPLPLKEMVRLSFTVGGGKKVRQKYNDGLPALLSDALKKIGFNEDRGASLSNDCAGLFKYQHNTDTDLKVVHVFPRIDPAAAAAAEPSAGGDAMAPEQLIAFSELATFQKMVAAKTPSLARRKRVLEVLKVAKSALASLEEKMAALQPLSDAEQLQYDSLDADGLDAKQAWLTQQMEAMVSGGQLTKNEQKSVLAQLASKLEALDEKLALAESAGKAKQADKLREARDELLKRTDAVRDLKPIVRKPKFEAEIKAARKKLADLDKLEGSKKVLPLDEVQKLAARPKLLEDLKAMVAESAGWFADADEGV